VKLVDFLHEDSIVTDLQATAKRAAIEELVDGLVRSRRVARGQTKGIVDALMAREKLGSTGIGRGVAVPHATHPGAKTLVGSVGLSRKGIDFHALDGKRVDLIFLLIYPPDREDRLEALRLLSRFVKQHDLCRFLRQARDARAVYEVLQEAESKLQEPE
jgi:mannitol/fructose-specific phosphotransferase system IIA component (Ntr-type)